MHAGRSSLDPAIASKLLQELKGPAQRPLTPEPLTGREIERALLAAVAGSERVRALFGERVPANRLVEAGILGSLGQDRGGGDEHACADEGAERAAGGRAGRGDPGRLPSNVAGRDTVER